MNGKFRVSKYCFTNNTVAFLIPPTEKIKYKVKIFADLMDDYKTGRYLYLYKKTPNSSAIKMLKNEMGIIEELSQNDNYPLKI